MTNPDTNHTPNITERYHKKEQSGIFDDPELKFSHQQTLDDATTANNYKLRTPRLKASDAINAVKPPGPHNMNDMSPNVIPGMDTGPGPNRLMQSDFPRTLNSRKHAQNRNGKTLKYSQSFNEPLNSRSQKRDILTSSIASSVRNTHQLPAKVGKKNFEQILKSKNKN